MTDQLLVPRELLDDLRDSLAAEIDDRANKFGEDYRPHILLGLREKLAAVDTLLAQPASEPKPVADAPLGAIENGRAFMDRLEQWYEFRDQLGHPLENCAEWQDVRRCFEHLAEFTHPAPAGVVLPGRKRVDPYCYDQGGNCHADGWNACREETARLNGVKP